MPLVNPRCTMRRFAIFFALLAPSVGLAADSHSLELYIEPSLGVQVDAAPQTLRFPAAAPGMALDETTATASTSIGYTLDDERALMIEVDRDPYLEAGLSIVARAQGSHCGDPVDVDLTTFPQPLIERTGTGVCAEQITVDYEGTVEDSGRLTNNYYTVVTYTVL